MQRGVPRRAGSFALLGGLFRRVVCFCVCPRRGSRLLEFFLEFIPSRLGCRDRLASSLGLGPAAAARTSDRVASSSTCAPSNPLLEFPDAAFELGDGCLVRGHVMLSGACAGKRMVSAGPSCRREAASSTVRRPASAAAMASRWAAALAVASARFRGLDGAAEFALGPP